MNHAERYQKLRSLTGRDKLDSSYDAAFYLMAADEVISDRMTQFISRDGIDFEGMEAETGGLSENQSALVSIAHNLFSWTSECSVTPFDISRLGYPLLDYVCQAFYIAVGVADVVYQDTEQPTLTVDMRRYNENKKMAEALNQLGKRVVSQ